MEFSFWLEWSQLNSLLSDDLQVIISYLICILRFGFFSGLSLFIHSHRMTSFIIAISLMCYYHSTAAFIDCMSILSCRRFEFF